MFKKKKKESCTLTFAKEQFNTEYWVYAYLLSTKTT